MIVVFHELPPGLEPGEEIHDRVAFDGYYFKLLRYDSTQEPKENGKYVQRVAPLLIGRTVELLDSSSPSIALMPAVMVVFGMIGAGVIVLIIWLRHGDRKVHEKTHESLTRLNPFDEQAQRTPPNVEPGSAWNRPNDLPN